MKPRFVALLLLAFTLLLVGMIPAVGAQPPVVPEDLLLQRGQRETRPYRPPKHSPQRDSGSQQESMLVPQEEPVDPLLTPRRAERVTNGPTTFSQSAPSTPAVGPSLPITGGPEIIPGVVLADSADESFKPSLSGDGRYTVFESRAQNLVPGDIDNHQPDVFIYDDQTNALELISVPQGGGDIWGYFYDPSISDDGRFVAFQGWANDIVPGEIEWSSDIYVLDRNDGSVIRVSDAFDGSEADGYSNSPMISPDGRYVAFSSSSTNLVPDDTNDEIDVFVHDIDAGTTSRVSISSSEVEADGSSYPGGVSSGGQFVSFYSYASNLVAGDTNETADVFVRDILNGTTERVSIADGVSGDEGNDYSSRPDVSDDGRYVAFESDASNLVTGDNNGCRDIFIRDRQNNTTTRVSLDENGDEADDWSFSSSLSGDGLTVAFDSSAGLISTDGNFTNDIYIRNWDTDVIIRATVDSGGNDSDNYSYGASLAADATTVAFSSYASNLVAGDDNEALDVYLRELPGGPTKWVSEDDFPLTQPNDNSSNPTVSDDGRFVAFSSLASNLVPGDNISVRDIFLYDRQLDETRVISTRYWGGQTNSNSYSASISDDGNRIVYHSYDEYIVSDDYNYAADVFVYDQNTDVNDRVSVSSSGDEANGESLGPAISGDGNVIAFESYADNLVTGDTNGVRDVFVHDLTTGETTRVSVDSLGNEANGESSEPALSEDGRYVAFSSTADNLTETDHNWEEDVYLHDRVTGETTLVSVSIWGDASSYASFDPAISADGRYIAFTSYSYDLIPEGEDENWAYDIFVRDMLTGVTVKISQAQGGEPADSDSWSSDISADGRYLTFVSWATNLVPNDLNDQLDVFIHDRLSGETVRISESAGGDEGNGSSETPAISPDGSTAVFSSFASNLVANDIFPFWDIFAVEQDVDDTLFTITGMAFDEDGYPLEGVVISSAEAPGNFAITDVNGEYTLTLPSGTFDLSATLSNYWFLPETQTVTVGPNSSGIDFEGVLLESYGYWLIPTADAYVDEAKKTTNFGSAPILRVKNSSKDMNAYLKYEVDGFESDPGQCYRFYDTFLVNHVKEPSVDGGSVYSVSNSWTESGINWNNAPAITGSPLGNAGEVSDESTEWTHIGVPIHGNGIYSFAIRSNSSDSVDYQSKEGQFHPWLYFSYSRDFDARLTANFSASMWSGLVPLVVKFTDQSYGCPASWHWDFGDGTSSTEQNPSHTYTDTGYYNVTLTVTNSYGTDTIEMGQIAVVEPPDQVFMSLSKKLTVGGLTIEPADIVLYDKSANTWQMVYDGSDHVTKANISSFTWVGDDLLIVFSGSQTIAGLGTATQYDVVRFTPNTPGVFPLGPGVFNWEFQGKLHGLTTGSEKIDALGRYYQDSIFSIAGNGSLPYYSVADEDLFNWSFWDFDWYHYPWFDGSTIPGMAAEDINGVWYDDWTDDYYVVITGKFNLGGVAGNDASIVRLTWANGQWVPSLHNWLAPGAPAFKGKIDAIELRR